MKININKKEKIESAIKAAEGRATKRLLTYEEIITACENAEKKLNQIGIAKKYWTICTVEIIPEIVCLAYTKKGAADGTYAKIRRFSTGWFLIFIYRDRCGSCPEGAASEDRLHLSEAAIENMPTSFTI